MSLLSEWILGWQRVAKFKVVCSLGTTDVEKSAIGACRYALPSATNSTKPKTPPTEELRFWLGYHCKATRYIDSNFKEFSEPCRDLIELLSSYSKNIVDKEWEQFVPEDFVAKACDWSIADGLLSLSGKWSGVFIAKGGRLRLIQTVFPTMIHPMCIAISTCAFLKQAAIYNEPKLVSQCCHILNEKIRQHNPMPLAGVGGIANAVWFEALMAE